MSIHGILLRVGVAMALSICVADQTVCGQGANYFVSVVAPNILEKVEGNSAGWYPFDGLLTSSRYQQVYDASQFSSIADGGGHVFLIAFRLDGSCGSSTGQTISNLQINLSTTSRGPDSLSPVFEENVGPDNTTVVGPGQFSIFGNCFGNDPENLTMHVVLRSLFFYDPTCGNLLLDIRNISGSNDDGFLLRLDGHDVTGDSISSLLAFNANAQSASRSNSFGFVTRFEIQPTPRLHLTVMGTNLVFRWVNHPGNWALQRNPTFGANSIWQPAGGTITTNAGNREITLPLDPQASTRFFRLILLPSPSGTAGLQMLIAPETTSREETEPCP